MATVRDHVKRYKSGASQADINSDVLLEAGRADPLPEPSGKLKRQRWGTQIIEVQELGEGSKEKSGHDHIIALQELIKDESQVFELKKSEGNPSPNICIGRARRNDIILDDATVSSQHAYIEHSKQRASFLVDFRSSNGTFINDERLTEAEAVRLQTGDRIRFGDRIFYFLTADKWLAFLTLRCKMLDAPKDDE